MHDTDVASKHAEIYFPMHNQKNNSSPNTLRQYLWCIFSVNIH
jgi:hypothetical protein